MCEIHENPQTEKILSLNRTKTLCGAGAKSVPDKCDITRTTCTCQHKPAHLLTGIDDSRLDAGQLYHVDGLGCVGGGGAV